MVGFGVEGADDGPNGVLNDVNPGLEGARSLLGEAVDSGGEHQRMEGGDHHEIQVLELRPAFVAPRLQPIDR